MPQTTRNISSDIERNKVQAMKPPGSVRGAFNANPSTAMFIYARGEEDGEEDGEDEASHRPLWAPPSSLNERHQQALSQDRTDGGLSLTLTLQEISRDNRLEIFQKIPSDDCRQSADYVITPRSSGRRKKYIKVLVIFIVFLVAGGLFIVFDRRHRQSGGRNSLMRHGNGNLSQVEDPVVASLIRPEAKQRNSVKHDEEAVDERGGLEALQILSFSAPDFVVVNPHGPLSLGGSQRGLIVLTRASFPFQISAEGANAPQFLIGPKVPVLQLNGVSNSSIDFLYKDSSGSGTAFTVTALKDLIDDVRADETIALDKETRSTVIGEVVVVYSGVIYHASARTRFVFDRHDRGVSTIHLADPSIAHSFEIGPHEAEWFENSEKSGSHLLVLVDEDGNEQLQVTAPVGTDPSNAFGDIRKIIARRWPADQLVDPTGDVRIVRSTDILFSQNVDLTHPLRLTGANPYASVNIHMLIGSPSFRKEYVRGEGDNYVRNDGRGKIEVRETKRGAAHPILQAFDAALEPVGEVEVFHRRRRVDIPASSIRYVDSLPLEGAITNPTKLYFKSQKPYHTVGTPRAGVDYPRIRVSGEATELKFEFETPHGEVYVECGLQDVVFKSQETHNPILQLNAASPAIHAQIKTAAQAAVDARWPPLFYVNPVGQLQLHRKAFVHFDENAKGDAFLEFDQREREVDITFGLGFQRLLKVANDRYMYRSDLPAEGRIHISFSGTDGEHTRRLLDQQVALSARTLFNPVDTDGPAAKPFAINGKKRVVFDKGMQAKRAAGKKTSFQLNGTQAEIDFVITDPKLQLVWKDEKLAANNTAVFVDARTGGALLTIRGDGRGQVKAQAKSLQGKFKDVYLNPRGKVEVRAEGFFYFTLPLSGEDRVDMLLRKGATPSFNFSAQCYLIPHESTSDTKAVYASLDGKVRMTVVHENGQFVVDEKNKIEAQMVEIERALPVTRQTARSGGEERIAMPASAPALHILELSAESGVSGNPNLRLPSLDPVEGRSAYTVIRPLKAVTGKSYDAEFIVRWGNSTCIIRGPETLLRNSYDALKDEIKRVEESAFLGFETKKDAAPFVARPFTEYKVGVSEERSDDVLNIYGDATSKFIFYPTLGTNVLLVLPEEIMNVSDYVDMSRLMKGDMLSLLDGKKSAADGASVFQVGSHYVIGDGVDAAWVVYRYTRPAKVAPDGVLAHIECAVDIVITGSVANVGSIESAISATLEEKNSPIGTKYEKISGELKAGDAVLLKNLLSEVSDDADSWLRRLGAPHNRTYLLQAVDALEEIRLLPVSSERNAAHDASPSNPEIREIKDYIDNAYQLMLGFRQMEQAARSDWYEAVDYCASDTAEKSLNNKVFYLIQTADEWRDKIKYLSNLLQRNAIKLADSSRGTIQMIGKDKLGFDPEKFGFAVMMMRLSAHLQNESPGAAAEAFILAFKEALPELRKVDADMGSGSIELTTDIEKSYKYQLAPIFSRQFKERSEVLMNFDDQSSSAKRNMEQLSMTKGGVEKFLTQSMSNSFVTRLGQSEAWRADMDAEWGKGDAALHEFWEDVKQLAENLVTRCRPTWKGINFSDSPRVFSKGARPRLERDVGPRIAEMPFVKGAKSEWKKVSREYYMIDSNRKLYQSLAEFDSDSPIMSFATSSGYALLSTRSDIKYVQYKHHRLMAIKGKSLDRMGKIGRTLVVIGDGEKVIESFKAAWNDPDDAARWFEFGAQFFDTASKGVPGDKRMKHKIFVTGLSKVSESGAWLLRRENECEPEDSREYQVTSEGKILYLSKKSFNIDQMMSRVDVYKNEIFPNPTAVATSKPASSSSETEFTRTMKGWIVSRS